MGQLLKHRYLLIKALGSDASSTTVLAGDTKVQGQPRRVVKQIKLPTTNPRTLEVSLVLLRKKAVSLQALSAHAQIPTIIEHFHEGQSFYLVEEFVAGRSLSSQLLPGQPWAIAPVLTLLRQVLGVLQFIHARGTIHLGIKPASLIERQSDGRWVLTGFGIFREISAQVLRAQGHAPQPAPPEVIFYLAPEQVIGKAELGSDLYALGLIALQALSGKTPRELNQLRQTAAGQTPPGSWFSFLDLDPALMALLKRLVHPDPQERYPNAAAALQALAAWEQESRLSVPAEPARPRPTTKGQAPALASEHLAPVYLPPSSPEPAELALAAALSPLPAPEPAPAEPAPPRPRRGGFWVGGLVLGILGLGAIAGVGLGLPQALVGYYFWQQGEAAAKRGEWAMAVAAYDQALTWQPRSGRVYLGRGVAQREQGDTQAALEDLTAAIQHSGEPAIAYYQRGNLRFLVGDRQGAIEDYTAAIAARPDFAAAYVNRGNAHADGGNDPRALADYNQAVELENRLAAAYLNRCLSRSNLEDHEGAIADCNRAISLQPTSPLAYQNRGLARRRLGDLPGALADYNIAIELDPEDADPYYNRGLTRQDLGDVAGAIADFTAAIARNPDHVLVYHDRGLAHRRLGEREAAIADFQQAAQRCLSSGRLGCYEDAQYELAQLATSPQEIQAILKAIGEPLPETTADPPAE